jgi:glycosyltransferase involved in cell wall biosynthesis
MKIVLDLRKYDGVVGGVEQGGIQLARHATGAGHQVLLLCKEKNLEGMRALLGGQPGLRIVPLPVRSHVISLANARLDAGFIQDLAERERADLVHFFYNWSFPYRKKTACVLTIHDVIPFTFREAMPFVRNHGLYRPGLRLATRLNDAITTVSDYSRRDIARKTGTPLEKIRVVPNGLREPAPPDPAREAELEARLGLADGFVLNVGGIHERKNVPRLIHAFARLVAVHGYRGKLLVTGSASGAPYQERMRRLCDAAVTEAGMADRVVFTGFVPEDDLDLLVRRAQVLVYPSLYEGFGIPILEAMKVGTPVVTSNVTAMPEVAGDAAVLVDPLDVEVMAEGIDRVLRDADLRRTLQRRGRERAAAFSWEAACGQYLDVYRDVVERTRARRPGTGG